MVCYVDVRNFRFTHNSVTSTVVIMYIHCKKLELNYNSNCKYTTMLN